MDQLTFPFYILAQTVSNARPELIQRLEEWHKQYSSKEVEQKLAFNPTTFCQNVGLNAKHSAKFHSLYHASSPQQFEYTLNTTSITAINLFEANYPPQLRQIPDPPLVLYCQGNRDLFHNQLTIGVVGSRRATSYGKLVIQKLLAPINSQSVIIVSGLAFGIDAEAHRIALKNQLPTIAVLGSSIDESHLYPTENINLAKEILTNNGLLLSEYPPPTAARKHQFVARNRIIAGLSSAVIIIEAAEKSGALITADFALDFNRTVFAVPGSILSPMSAGPHRLIQHGALLLQSVQDILAELNLTALTPAMQQPQSTAVATPKLTAEQQRVLKYMQLEPITFEQLLVTLAIPTQQLQVLLSQLELKQLIKPIGPQLYQKL
ncbi:MAG TPA: DNA-processing protein DprA [Candidatus Doudnabacteria bacterium]|nr:DNA-processing protein DprA [Candidatus Doudnabacteria bacterium]